MIFILLRFSFTIESRSLSKFSNQGPFPILLSRLYLLKQIQWNTVEHSWVEQAPKGKVILVMSDLNDIIKLWLPPLPKLSPKQIHQVLGLKYSKGLRSLPASFPWCCSCDCIHDVSVIQVRTEVKAVQPCFILSSYLQTVQTTGEKDFWGLRLHKAGVCLVLSDALSHCWVLSDTKTLARVFRVLPHPNTGRWHLRHLQEEAMQLDNIFWPCELDTCH